MAKAGDNNPRAFGDTISLESWRTTYDEKTGEADLHISAVFSEGRIGGDASAPVRFRLSLRRAEVHVMRDGANVLKLKPSSILQAGSAEITRTLRSAASDEKGTTGTLDGLKLPKLEGSRKSTRERELTETQTTDSVTFLSMKTHDGYVFKIKALDEERTLEGSPWQADLRVLTIIDTGHTRNKGEPPELRVELRCRREDLIISDVQLLERGKSTIGVSANKMLVVEQYIKSELWHHGFAVDNLSDPFAMIVLADVSPEEN